MEYRHELKFLVPDITLEKIKYRLSPFMETDEHHDSEYYTIRSLYFDDYFDKCLNENRAGTDNRFKYRIRYYLDNPEYINLEKKYKLRGMTKKDSETITASQVNGFLQETADVTDGKLATELFAANLKSGMQPKCIVEYDRCAFVEPAGNVRITFDKNLRGSTEVERFFDTSEEFPIPVMEPGWHILEVKYDEFLPRHLLQLVDINNLHRQSFSKYAMVREELKIR
ncbi:VTC domain-containing protein [Pseudobutyrivibrio sp. ACV-2]|uniref:polyphosphate polymerase domain-containing protein n=1 Tax=Pseudobutyrivibrio sp. ACV-2 TaxID=1520801 RepID=UPI0008945CEF|nr:polyphosphate polymerase domain-containing protein [Pseudobutyrivibrio sp. ACV-2]SEA51693.1 VTC domain-containing protein [Pseudobutyrivibrio sp. ACV-2]